MKHSYITYKIEENKKDNTVAITVNIEQERLSPNDDNVPWKKFATRNARAALLDAGHMVETAVATSMPINNAEGPAAGTWVFSTVPDAPVKTPRATKKKASSTRSRAKSTSQ